ncbi:TAF6-like RNA polymerase II p300/CBP-associated factor-associated factor 65 kDa subunit 6L [Ischnura elegans]|uniref:TAF6-like RNA polymerase II p300/CBP-associated factor-associated factor 65 kDa subunit 6L n=1 Tax=Ischnura elegans TaxID=197161 RepID=UPI001ED89A69|nr:TAF6-like RNA polymerase II p300/CBP-associated factor-associated factor 65 kDa subunit 6L [Ischnura elegans]
MNPKTDKLSHRKKEEKKPGEGRRYAQISVDSVNAAADSIGISSLSEEAAKRLADDVSYRLREVIHKCGVYLRHSNRSKLTSNDLNFVLHLSDAPRCYGSTDSLRFISVKEARVFVPEDEEVDLITTSLQSEVYLQRDECYIKGSWVFPDLVRGENRAIKSEEASNASPNESIQILPHHLEYYKQIGKSLLGKSRKCYQIAVDDLKNNQKISPVVPMIVNFIAAYIYQHKCHGIRIFNLLQAIDALIENNSVDMRAFDASNTLVTSLLLFATNPQPIHGKSLLDDEYLRKTASRMIVKVLKHWHPLEVVLYVELYYNLAGTLMNPQNPLLSHLGALHAINCLGSEALDKCLWPNLSDYLTILEEANKSNIVNDIKGAILTAAEKLFVKNVNSENIREAIVFKCDVELQTQLYDYFGDAICVRRRWCGTPGNVVDKLREGSSDSHNRVNSRSESTGHNSFHTFRCLPILARKCVRYSVDDFFGCDDEDQSQNQVVEMWTPKQLSACKLRFPRKLYECHSMYSRMRYIGKTRRKRVNDCVKNISGNILVSL